MTDTVAPLAPFPATEIPAIRHDWTVAEIQTIHDLPLLDLVFRAAQVHRAHNDPAEYPARRPAVDQDRRLSGGLRLLSTIGASQGHRPAA